MRRIAPSAVILLALFAAGTGAAQPKGAPTASPKPPSVPAPSAAPKSTSALATTSAASAAPKPTSAPATTAAPIASDAPAATTAAPVSASDEAGRLFSQGREAYKSDSFESALDLFKKSYALDASPGTLLNIALTEEKLGRTASALASFERVVTLFKADDDRMPIAREGVSRTTVRAPRLKLARAAGAPPTMAIRVDGAPLDASLVGAEQPLDPGKHVITTSVFGYEDRAYEITLTDGQRQTIALEPGKRTLVAAPVVTNSPTATPASNTGRVVAAALGGVGLGGLGVGLVTGILAIGKKDELNTGCPTPQTCTGPWLKAYGETRTMADVSTASLIFGGVAVASSVAVLFLAGDGKSLFVSAAPTTGGAAFSATGRF